MKLKPNLKSTLLLGTGLMSFAVIAGQVSAPLSSPISTEVDEQSQQGQLQVEINSAVGSKGKMQVFLMNSAAQFNDNLKPYATCIETLKQNRVLCDFGHVPFGEYAVFAFHDGNDNNKLDTNFFGAPTEKIAVSRVDLATNGDPKFSDAKFECNRPFIQLMLSLQ